MQTIEDQAKRVAAAVRALAHEGEEWANLLVWDLSAPMANHLVRRGAASLDGYQDAVDTIIQEALQARDDHLERIRDTLKELRSDAAARGDAGQYDLLGEALDSMSAALAALGCLEDLNL